MRYKCGVGVVLLTLAGCGGRISYEGSGGTEALASGGAGMGSDPSIGGSTGMGSDPSIGGGTGMGSDPSIGGSPGVQPVGSGGTTGNQSGEPEPCGALIDDMENGSGRICVGEDRVGLWYAFNDGGGSQWPNPTPGVPIVPSFLEEQRDGSQLAMHTVGAGFECYTNRSWGAGIGVDLNFDGITYGQYDAMGSSGISFWARTDQEDEGDTDVVFVRINSAATTSTEFGGTCSKEVENIGTCNRTFAPIVLYTNWRFYELPFAGYPDAETQLVPNQDRSQLMSIQFFGAAGITQQCFDDGAFDFWIDDLRFY